MMLNMNATNNSLAGKLSINGVSRQAPENNTADPLTRGLRIARPSTAPSAAASQKAVEQAAKEEAKQKLIQNFEGTLLSRLEKTENPNAKEKTPADTRAEEAKTLAASITATIEQIKKEFGKEAANEVMANILTGTEDGVTADKIAKAVGSVFTAFANSAKEAAASGDASPDDLAKAEETNKKLEKMLQFLNEGEPGGGDGAEGASLRNSLNGFFGMADFAEDDQDRFSADFKWISRNEEIENEKAKGNDEKEFYLTLGELGQENTDKLVSFLRNDLGDEAAAQYVESLGEEGDLYSAVEELNKMFYEDSELVSGLNEDGLPILPHHEGPGMEKIFKLSQFLNDTILDEVNNLIRTDDTVRSRFLDLAEKRLGSVDDLPDTYGLTGWSFTGGSVKGATGEHNFSTSFNIHDTKGKTAEERNIDQIKGWADFNRVLADTHPEKKEQHLASAASFDKQYEDAMAAYKAKTAPTTGADEASTEENKINQIKLNADFNRVMAETDPLKREQYLKNAARMDQEYEKALAAYKAKSQPPTPPGSMVKTAV